MHASRATVLSAIGFASALLAPPGFSADAQSYPTKPIRIVTTAVGSGNDLVARLIAPKLSRALAQPVVVDNRGFIASEIVAKAAPDGYTLIAYGSPLWLAQFLHSVAYDPIRDFSPVVLT